MQNHFAQAVLCLMARDEPSNGYCATDRYTVSNGLVLMTANNNGHLTPCLPVKTGFLLH
ncbi:conserved hypothetical protein [Klebsiella pneumoniae]|nr:conserved hypothetical protein [Klebsiella pneumoniae]